MGDIAAIGLGVDVGLDCGIGVCDACLVGVGVAEGVNLAVLAGLGVIVKLPMSVADDADVSNATNSESPKIDPLPINGISSFSAAMASNSNALTVPATMVST